MEENKVIDNIQYLDNMLRETFKGCADFVINKIKSGRSEIGFYFLSSLTERRFMTDRIVRTSIDNPERADSFNGDFASMFPVAIISPCNGLKDAIEGILGGNTLVCIQNSKCYSSLLLTGETQGRSVNTPNTEGVLRGSYSAFTEDMWKNITLIRQMLRTEKFKSEIITVGKLSSTKVAICHIEGRAKLEVIAEIKRRLDAADVNYVADSSYIEIALENSPSLFRTAGSTEKPDKICSKLISGRVAIIADGSPFVLTVPYVFAENMQTTEDYTKSPIYSTFIRLIRFVAVLISIYLPAIFMAAVSDNIRLLPLELLLTVSSARRNIAYGLFGELLLMLVVFEIIREVGIRMPKNVGSAVGIVGSIILGDAAVQAGIASTTVIIVVSLSAISNFVLPPYVDSPVILRLSFLLAAYFLSFFGIFILTLLLMTRLCAKDSYGTPYMTPLSPFSAQGLSDFITVVPKKVLGRSEEKIAESENKPGDMS
ncbi:MAG: spore germination protein [Eubacteriales bacterium]|nr:spore germination protein [Eubacteriales bacterium]MDD4476402.1 spore germination protein [Eubacteriales bacterium]